MTNSGDGKSGEVELAINQKTILAILAASVGALVLAHLIHLYLFYFHQFYLPIIDLNREENIPTVFASMNLLFCGLLLLIIAVHEFRKQGEYRFLWFLLGVIFVLLACDEYFMIHDRLSRPLRRLLDLKGPLFYAWVVPYGILVVFFAIAYLKFLLNLPRKYIVLFIVSGSIYVTGALVLEMMGASRAEQYGRSDYLYAFWTTLEETFELIGILVFSNTLMSYLREQHRGVCIKIRGFSLRLYKS